MSTMQYSLDWDAKLPSAAQKGMARCDENAAIDWKHWFDGCVLAAARKKGFITSDDVLVEMESLPDPPSTHNLAAIGPAMVRASKMGLLRATDRYERSAVGQKHGNNHRVWESLVYKRGK